MEKATVITRSFQAGRDKKSFDYNLFAQRVAGPIKKTLKFNEVVDRLIVVTNGEEGNHLAEIITDGKTPTVIAIEKTFPKEIREGKIISHVCANWGANPGSGEALNEGTKIAEAMGAKWVLNWSPEMEIDGYLINEALVLAEQRALIVVGALRQCWWEKPQWNIPQNTVALWRLNALLSVNGFAPECNGTGETVYTPEFGKVLLAGMEDFHAMLRLMEKNTDNFRWGMIRRPKPLFWDTNFEPGSEREINHLKKVARQYLVMEEYAKKIFPEVPFKELMDEFFAHNHQG